MSSLAGSIVGQLLATSGVTDVIATRLYPDYDKQANKVYPLAVYKIENVTPLIANDGPTGSESADFIIAAIGELYADANAVVVAMQTALQGARGVWSGLTIQGIFLKEDGISDDVITEPQTEEILYYVKELTFEVKYNY